MSSDVFDREEPLEDGEICPNCGEWPVYFGDEVEMECPWCGETFSIAEDATPPDVGWGPVS
jgi:ribosomal protein S27AE